MLQQHGYEPLSKWDNPRSGSKSNKTSTRLLWFCSALLTQVILESPSKNRKKKNKSAIKPSSHLQQHPQTCHLRLLPRTMRPLKTNHQQPTSERVSLCKKNSSRSRSQISRQAATQNPTVGERNKQDSVLIAIVIHRPTAIAWRHRLPDGGATRGDSPTIWRHCRGPQPAAMGNPLPVLERASG